jgi:DNA-binding transcriptional MerR regulator
MAGKKKKYYRIGEVSKIAGIDTHIIRYWENVFPEIKPRRVSGQRLYRAKDLELVLKIKKLLHDDGFTVAGARKRLNLDSDVCDGADSVKRNMCDGAVCMTIRSELLELLDLLK